MRYTHTLLWTAPTCLLSDFSPRKISLRAFGQSPGCLHSRGFLKCHNSVQVSVLFTGRQHLDISTEFSSCSKSCCSTANLERAAHFYWCEQVGPLLSTQPAGNSLHIMSVGTWKVNKNPCGHWCGGTYPNGTAGRPVSVKGGGGGGGSGECFLLTQFKYAHMAGGNHSHVTN